VQHQEILDLLQYMALRIFQSSNVFILHPYNLISPTQRKFMTTINSDNVINIAVKGNFDDCQSIIKEIFSDHDYKKSNNFRCN
jgi:threonine synthase